MVAISKSMIVLSVLASAGLIAALDTVLSSQESTAAVQVSERFPRGGEELSPMSVTTFAGPKLVAQAGKGDRLPDAAACTGGDWPYLSEQCLISDDGNAVHKVTRVITIERRIGTNTSELLRMPVADLAQR